MKNPALKILLAIFLFALIVRIAWGLRQPSDEARLSALPDQVEYLSLGRNLLSPGMLFFDDHRFYQAVYAYRMPGYPVFIALCGGVLKIVRMTQAIIDAGSVFAVYLLGRKFLSERNALIAAGLIAINPFLIYFSGLILSETICTAMILWGAVFCISKRIWGPLLLALSVMVRPSGLALILILPLIGGVRWWKLLAGIALLCGMLYLWAWRNDAVLGKWVWTTTNAGITQYDGFNPQATGASDQRFVKEMPYLQQMNEVDRDAYLGALARKYIHEHPGRVLTLAAAKVARTFSPVPLSEQFGKPIYLLIAAAYSLPVFLLALIGLMRTMGKSRMQLFLLCVPIYFAFVHALSIGSLRYRLPAEPFIAILAAVGISNSTAETQRTRS